MAMHQNQYAKSNNSSKVENSMVNLYNDARKTLKEAVEKETDIENQEHTDYKVHLTPQKHKKILKGAFKSFMLNVLSEADIDGIFGQIKPHVKASIPKQVKVMQSTKVLGNIKEACENSYYVRP